MSTGPKISSRAMVMSLSTSAKSVGCTNQPFSNWSARPPPATTARTFVLALLDVAEHAVALLRADLRSHQVAGVGRVAVGEVLEPGRRDLDRLVVHRTLDEHPRRHHAALAAVHADHGGHRHLRLEVGVVEHDVGRLAAELEEQALHRRAALLEDALAGDGGSGEGDEVDERADGQLLADEVVGRRDHVEDPGGDVGLLGDEAAEVRRVPRRVGCRLEDHGVAGGERLPDLLDRHLEREVPRHDRRPRRPRLHARRCAPSAHRTRCRWAALAPTRTCRSSRPARADRPRAARRAADRR